VATRSSVAFGWGGELLVVGGLGGDCASAFNKGKPLRPPEAGKINGGV